MSEPNLNLDNTLEVDPETGLLQDKLDPSGSLIRGPELTVPDEIYRRGSWTVYTPQLSAGGIVPATGLGDCMGEYMVDGDVCYFYSSYIFNTISFAGGVGAIFFGLPLRPRISNQGRVGYFSLSAIAHLYDDSTGDARTYSGYRGYNNPSGANFILTGEAGTGLGMLNNSSPWAWNIDDRIGITGMFPV